MLTKSQFQIEIAPQTSKAAPPVCVEISSGSEEEQTGVQKSSVLPTESESATEPAVSG